MGRVPDPRDPRGVRYPIVAMLMVVVGAMLAGALSFAAIGEWCADLDATRRAALGFTGSVPGSVTIWRLLVRIDAPALDEVVNVWTRACLARVNEAARARAPDRLPVRRVLAVDGKAMRATLRGTKPMHLLSALDQASGLVVAQVSVDVKTNARQELVGYAQGSRAVQMLLMAQLRGRLDERGLDTSTLSAAVLDEFAVFRRAGCQGGRSGLTRRAPLLGYLREIGAPLLIPQQVLQFAGRVAPALGEDGIRVVVGHGLPAFQGMDPRSAHRKRYVATRRTPMTSDTIIFAPVVKRRGRNLGLRRG